MKELATPYDAKVGKYYLIYATNKDTKTVYVVKVSKPHDGYDEKSYEYEIVGGYSVLRYIGNGENVPRYSININTGICSTYWKNDVLYKLTEDEFNKHVLMEMI
jgi:hypothetical protein